METRAHHLLIGSFAIGITLLTVLFLFWIGKFEFNRQYQLYDLKFQGSVSGLSKAGDVLYNGIKVGEVTEIKIDEDNPKNVLVRIQVERTTPVKEDSYARLETMGLTGVAAIQIAGGGPKSNPLVAEEGQRFPVIPTKESVISELFTSAPQLVERGNVVLERAARFLNADNEKKFSDTVDHLERLTANLAKASDKFDSISTNVDKLVAGDAKATLADIRGVASDIRQVMNEARGPLRDFARQGLPELLLAISDARQMIGSIDRAAQRLESSPSSILFGDKAVEYKAGGTHK
jgi:phospholipid/cholesterol/gamma-HCH transport system substrate-binding protein